MDKELQDAARLRAEVEAEPFVRNLGAYLDGLAQEMGDAPAANFFEAGTVLSYREIADRTRSLAAGLSARGLRFGDPGGVFQPNNPAFPQTRLARARIGAIKAPIKPP